MRDVEDRPREQLRLRIPQRALERRVHTLEVAVEPDDAEEVDREIEELLELGSGARHLRSQRYPGKAGAARASDRQLRSTRRDRLLCGISPAGCLGAMKRALAMIDGRHVDEAFEAYLDWRGECD